jgi:methyl-accepting chemotaxis protein
MHKMKIKFKLSLVMIALVVIVVTGIAALLLRKASSISLDLNKQCIEALARHRAEYWNGREAGYIKILRTLAEVMGAFESIPTDERRDHYADMLKSVLKTEGNIVAMYTVWKPNAIDGLDELNIGRIGSGPKGQYAVTFSKETGKITERTCIVIDDIMAHISGPNARKDLVEHPTPFKVNGKDTFIVRFVAPIINPNTEEVVGGVGCFLSIDAMQPTIENFLARYKGIDAMSIYSSNGFILACHKPERIGKMLIDEEIQYGDKKTK